MRKLVHFFSAIAMLTLGCIAGRCEATSTPLSFYIVSEEKIEGGKFINTTNLPELGYISATPDLVITNLLDVYPEKRVTVVPFKPVPGLVLVFRPDVVKRFTVLTEKALGKRLLMTLGDRPLTAPQVVSPIRGNGISIDFSNEIELKKTQEELKKLVN